MNHDAYDDNYIRSILNNVKSIAMVGASPVNVRPSYFAFKYLAQRGYDMIPVNPGHVGKALMGKPFVASLADIDRPVDMIDIFRQSDAVPGIVDEALAVLTADCLPVLFCDRAASRVAAAHAGWRGLAGGVLETTLEALAIRAEDVLVWLGPAIGPAAFEVGGEVREAFVAQHPAAAAAFVPSRNEGRFMADLYQLARIRLAAVGVEAVYGGGLCTFGDPRFYSYRRASRTGRFASLIWLEP